MDTKLYIINLKHRTDNRKEMKGKLAYLDLPYEFIDAVYGKDLPDNYFEQNGIKINSTFRNPYTNSTITKGEIGCALSHYNAWKRAMEEGVKYPIIMEDDIEFTADFIKVLNDLVKNPPNFDVIYLSRKLIGTDNGVHSKINDTHNLVNMGFSYWLNAYMLTQKSVKALVNSGFLKNLIVVDEFIPMLYTGNNSRYYHNNNYTIDKMTGFAVEPQIVRPKKDTFLFSETEGQPFYTIKYRDDFYDNKIQLVTVGTDPVDGYKRFVESANIYSFPYICLGFGEPWGGNDMIKGPGGGHKVVLLKKYLENFADTDERLLIFSDCYDAVVSGSPDQVIEKFLTVQKNTGCDVMFSAEAICWPDKSIANQFPDKGTPYKFLNSGGFIGSIKSLKKLTASPIKSSDDDQYYYQLEYLKSVKGESEISIILDDFAYIFQTLSSHFDKINIDYGQSKVVNNLTNSRPILIHGNGGEDSKLFLNRLCNYINLKFRDIYGYKDTHSRLKKLDTINYHEYPRILVTIFLENTNKIGNISNLFKQKYPFSQLDFTVLNGSGEDINKYIDSLKLKFKKNVNVIDTSNNAFTIKGIYNDLIDKVLPKYDYMFIGNINHVISDRFMFEKLICSNLDIVSPMLVGMTNTNFSNFWGAVTNEGYYARSFDYFDILHRKNKGYWNVPYISGSIMVHSSKFQNLKDSMSRENVRDSEITDFDMYLSRCIRTRYNFMHIVNYTDYGYILD